MEYFTLESGLSQEERYRDLDICVKEKIQGMIKTLLEEEIEAYMESRRDKRLADGKSAVVRNGYHRERKFGCLSGTIKAEVPRTRNRCPGDEDKFISKLIPPYMRRSLKIDEAIPLMYLRGLSNGDMMPVLNKLFGKGMSGLSPTNITRLKKVWRKDIKSWKSRDLSKKQYCYIWADGIHVNVRFGSARLCILVVIGALASGRKEVIAVESGYRESAESWSVLLRDLKERGMPAPSLVIGDGALGMWKALRNVYPQSGHQRCWVHKMANVLDKLPKSVQAKAKSMLHEIYNAPDKEKAEKAFDTFIGVFEAKYYKATECLLKDRERLLTFYNYPAEHWKHIRTTNAIESTFSTVRLRTAKTRGQGTEEMTLLMIYKLIEQASMRWQRLNGHALISKVIAGITFVDGEEINQDSKDAA